MIKKLIDMLLKVEKPVLEITVEIRYAKHQNELRNILPLLTI